MGVGILLGAATFAASGMTDTGGVQAKTHSDGGLRARLEFRNTMGASGLGQSREQRVCRKSSRCMHSLQQDTKAINTKIELCTPLSTGCPQYLHLQSQPQPFLNTHTKCNFHSGPFYVVWVPTRFSYFFITKPTRCTNFTYLLWSCSNAVYKPVWHIPVPSVQWINSWRWADELSETCRVSWQNKFVKLLHLVGFITKKFVTMQRGHMDVKNVFLMYVTNVITFAHGIQGVPNGVQASIDIHFSNTLCTCAVHLEALQPADPRQSNRVYSFRR
jgi:hypothetical protein